MSPGVIGSSETVKLLPQSIFNHLFCFCQYSETPSLLWDVNICQLAESPGHSSNCFFFLLSATLCVIFIDFYLTVCIFFQPKLPISISSPSNFCCKAIMETIFKNKKINFNWWSLLQSLGLYAAHIRKGGEIQGTRIKQEIELIFFFFFSLAEKKHASLLAGAFVWDHFTTI